MAIWMKFLLSQGHNQHGEQIISPDALQLTFNAETAMQGTVQLLKPEHEVAFVSSSVMANGYGLGYYNGKSWIFNFLDV